MLVRYLAVLLLASAGLAAAERSVADLIDKATTALSQFSFDQPRKPFRLARERAAKGSPEWQQATFGLATCQHHIAPATVEGIAEATALYAELAATAPDSTYTSRCVLNLGRLAELVDFYQDPVDIAEARARYREVAQRWPTQDIAGEATFRLASSLVQSLAADDLAQAITTLDGWLASHPQEPLAPAMWQYLGDVHFLYRQDWQAALDAYRKADDLGLIWAGREAIVWWRMAVLAETKLNDRATAIRYYTRICTDGQTSGKAFEAQLALARLGVQPPELSAFATYPGAKPVFTVAPGVAP